MPSNDVVIESPARLWNWVLCKQGLSDETRLPDAHSVAVLSLGLHAARVGSPYATVAARTFDDAPLQHMLGPVDNSQLVTIRCMRRTLHTLPVGMASHAHAATRQYRMRDLEGRARRIGLSLQALEPIARDIVSLLHGRGRMPHRAIEVELAAVGRHVDSIRLALKLLWESGDLTYRNCSPSWHRELRQFELRTRSHPGFNPAISAADGTTVLMEEYFRRYGPATLKDASWWSGLGQATIAQSVAHLELVKMDLPWAAKTFYMLADQFQEFVSLGASTPTTRVQLLAHEDVALKAYFESRSRYLGRSLPPVAFNQIGEVLPTIVNDGVIIGTWRWNRQLRCVDTSFIPGLARHEVRKQATKRAEILTQRLHHGYVSK
jgi:hypothetical protein